MGGPGFGPRAGAAEIAKRIVNESKPRGADWVGWRMKYKNITNPNVKLPVDDPWTYKNTQQHQMYSPWKDWNPNPVTDEDWRNLTRDRRYTQYHPMDVLKKNYQTRVVAGREYQSRNDEKWAEMTGSKHDLRKPLALQQRQRNMVNDHQEGLLETGATRGARDKFLSPNPIQRKVDDGSATSARTRMKAMQQFRKMGPDAMLRVPKATVLRDHPDLAEHADDLPDSVDFNTFLQLRHPPSTYYKLGGEEIPADQRVTSSTRFPLGFARTGSVTAYGGGTLATGS